LTQFGGGLLGPGALAATARSIAPVGRHRGFVGLSLIAVGVLLVATRGASFYHDEWQYIHDRSFGDPSSWFLPHVQHFVAIHAAVYTALVAVFGTSNYLPFLAVLFAAHVGFSASVYTLIDRHVGRGPALTAAAILLLLGSGYYNLFWAFQMGAIGSAAFAMWGLLVIRDRPGLGALLMSLGVATQGFAFFLVPAAALYGWRRRALAACSVPLLVYAAWYVVIGRSSMVAYGDLPTLAGWVGWMLGGVAASAAALTGLWGLGLLMLAGALVLVIRVPDRRAAAVGIAALLTEYAILGISRQGVNLPTSSTYLYFGAAFLLPVFASAWPAVPRRVRPAVGVLAGVALGVNFAVLAYWSSAWANAMTYDPLCVLCLGR
jgi:hypothetical protein